jgi:hypothetical protein
MAEQDRVEDIAAAPHRGAGEAGRECSLSIYGQTKPLHGPLQQNTPGQLVPAGAQQRLPAPQALAAPHRQSKSLLQPQDTPPMQADPMVPTQLEQAVHTPPP